MKKCCPRNTRSTRSTPMKQNLHDKAVGDLRSCGRIDVSQSRQCFANDKQLAFNEPAQHLISQIIIPCLSTAMSLDGAPGIQDISEELLRVHRHKASAVLRPRQRENKGYGSCARSKAQWGALKFFLILPLIPNNDRKVLWSPHCESA